MPTKKLTKKKLPAVQQAEQDSITDYAKLIETAILDAATGGQADVWRQQNFHYGFFGVFSIDQIKAILKPHEENKQLTRAILAGIISVCVQELLKDQ
jgi:hypothetical protein